VIGSRLTRRSAVPVLEMFRMAVVGPEPIVAFGKGMLAGAEKDGLRGHREPVSAPFPAQRNRDGSMHRIVAADRQRAGMSAGVKRIETPLRSAASG